MASVANAECTLAGALMESRPGEAWVLRDDQYEGLTWLAETPIPTAQEVLDFIAVCVEPSATPSTRVLEEQVIALEERIETLEGGR